MNHELTNNRTLHEAIDALSKNIADETSDENLQQLLSALNIALIHPHHIDQHPCKNIPEDMRILIGTGLRHLLWKAHDQVHTIAGAREMVHHTVARMLKQNNAAELSLRLHKCNEQTHPEPEVETELAA